MDEVNDHSSRLLADNVHLAPDITEMLEALNTRYRQLQVSVQQRLRSLNNALRDFGPSSQHFLSSKFHYDVKGWTLLFLTN